MLQPFDPITSQFLCPLRPDRVFGRDRGADAQGRQRQRVVSSTNRARRPMIYRTGGFARTAPGIVAQQEFRSVQGDLLMSKAGPEAVIAATILAMCIPYDPAAAVPPVPGANIQGLFVYNGFVVARAIPFWNCSKGGQTGRS